MNGNIKYKDAECIHWPNVFSNCQFSITSTTLRISTIVPFGVASDVNSVATALVISDKIQEDVEATNRVVRRGTHVDAPISEVYAQYTVGGIGL